MKKNIFFYWTGDRFMCSVHWLKEESAPASASVFQEKDGFLRSMRSILS